jgi:hypothetical protein
VPCCENFLYGFKAARRAARAANAASLSRAAWRSITSRQFVGYGPALSVAVPAGPAGPGRAYRPRPVLERKPFQGANSLIVTVFGEEEQAGDSCQHALELIDRAAVTAAFAAEYPPRLHLCHGVLDDGTDLAEVRIEFPLPVFKFPAAEPLEWHDADAVDSDVAKVCARADDVRLPGLSEGSCPEPSKGRVSGEKRGQERESQYVQTSARQETRADCGACGSGCREHVAGHSACAGTAALAAPGAAADQVPAEATGLGQLSGLLPWDHLTQESAIQVNLSNETVRLPLYPGIAYKGTPHQEKVWYILLDASDSGLAHDLG